MQWMPTARKLIGGYKVVLADCPPGDSPMPIRSRFDAAAAQYPVLAKLNPDSTVASARSGRMIAVSKRASSRAPARLVHRRRLKFTIPIPQQKRASSNSS